MQETRVEFLGQEDPLEKEMATHSSILAWKTPMNSMKKKKDMTPEDEPPSQKVPNNY